MPKSDPNERKWKLIALILLIAIIGFALVKFVFFPALAWGEERQAGENAVENEIDAEKAVEQYEEFRTLWHEIQTQRNQNQNNWDEHGRFHETYGDDPSQWSRSAETRHNRIHARITGGQNTLDRLVGEYNAKSDMAHKEMFKCNLPYQVDDRFAISGPPGSEAPDEPNDTFVEGANPDAKPPEPEECDGLPDEVSRNNE